MMSTLIPILAGASFVLHGAGELENTMAVSYEKILVDHEIIEMARRFARGMGVDADTLAVDVINDIGGGPRGQFLQHEHTFRHFRREQYMPQLFVRDIYSDWEKAGKKGVARRAADRVSEILASHEPMPLPAEAQKEIDAIYKSATKVAENL